MSAMFRSHSSRKQSASGSSHHRRKSSSGTTSKDKQDKHQDSEGPPSSSAAPDKDADNSRTSKHKSRSSLSSKHLPALLRLPSSSSNKDPPAPSPRSRRATTSASATPTDPSTPTALQPAPSPSYFASQSAATPSDPRSPGSRRPPASHSSGHVDNSRGPPITLLTRGNSDIVRRSSQSASDFAYTQQQLAQAGIVSPGSSRGRRSRDPSPAPQPQQATAPNYPNTLSRRNTSKGPRPKHNMTSSVDDSSGYESGTRNHSEEYQATSDTDEEQTEDLFLNIAADQAPKPRPSPRPVESAARVDRLKSRIARVNNRQSLPSALPSPSPAQTNGPTQTTTRIPSTSTVDTQATTHRRPSYPSYPSQSSQLPTVSRRVQERSPLAPATTPRPRHELQPKTSFSSKKDSDLSPREFLAQFGRRPSQPENNYTPPGRTQYRPSNLNYSSTRDEPKTPQTETPAYETNSRADGTESHGSTGPAASVWDELDELKTRIRKIELGGKIPSTSGAVVSQASGERPRTANTSATTVSSSPNQQRKPTISPAESTANTHMPNNNTRVHPLLREALAKARQNLSPSVYRILEATATESLALAEMSGSAGPQGTLHSASSILGASSVSDRQVRRKADNICRSLTELCIALCDTKAMPASPAINSSAAASIRRRPSVSLNSINGDSPTVRQSIEPESGSASGVSPSRALSRIEARRTSTLLGGNRESSLDPYEERQIPSRLSRAGTSLHRNRGSLDEDEDDPTMRAPSRAMTDFRSLRPAKENRYSSSRQYTSREPMPELAPSPALQSPMTLRRPTIPGGATENSSLLFRDSPRRYELHRESSPAYEKQTAGTLRARANLSAARNPNRNSMGGIQDLGRSVSLGRRQRGSSIGE